MSLNAMITFHTVSSSQSIFCRLLKRPIRGSKARLSAPDWTVFVCFFFFLFFLLLYIRPQYSIFSTTNAEPAGPRSAPQHWQVGHPCKPVTLHLFGLLSTNQPCCRLVLPQSWIQYLQPGSKSVSRRMIEDWMVRWICCWWPGQEGSGGGGLRSLKPASYHLGFLTVFCPSDCSQLPELFQLQGGEKNMRSWFWTEKCVAPHAGIF